MNKKAFTLIELLAVIVILGIIAGILVAEVLTTLEESKKSALKISTQELVKTINDQIYFLKLNKKSTVGTYTIQDGLIVEASDYSYSVNPEYSGNFTVNSDGQIGALLHNDNWCVSKGESSQDYSLYKNIGDCIIATDSACFTFNSATQTITDYSDTCPKDVIIPPEINGVVVSILGVNSFRENSITSVVIPNTVYYIDTSAFETNLLTEVELPSNLTYIGVHAFYNNNLIDLVIPNGVTTIDSWAFFLNNLLTVTIPDSVTVIEDLAFASNNLTEIVIPNGISVIRIGAFKENDLTDLVIPDSVITIENEAFEYNELLNLHLSSNVNYIGNYAFKYNNLTDLVIPSSVNVISNSAFQNNHLANVTFPNGITTIRAAAFEDNLLTSVSLPSSLTTIGATAFRDNRLNTILLPSSLTSIGFGAFANNLMEDVSSFIYNRNGDGSENVTSLNSYAGANLTPTIPNGITTVGDSAFENKKVTSITIPSGVTYIGTNAFNNNNLTSVIFNGTAMSANAILQNAFRKTSTSNSALSSIIYPGTNVQNWNYAINGVTGTSFTTGTVTNANGNVLISAN